MGREARRWGVGLLLMAAVLLGGQSAAAERFDVFALAIGSTDYAPASGGQHAFPKIRGANKSARLVADRLLKGGAAYGLVLTSSDGHYISLADIQGAFSRVRQVLKDARPRNPLLVIYFAGHGVSEGVGWNHFSIPGTFVYRGALASFPLDDLAKTTLHAGSFADDIDQIKVPYLLVLDTCYEGTLASFESPVLTATATRNLADVATALRVMNEFHQTNPVLFSTAPGTIAKTVADPTDPAALPVAPLARRLLLIADPVLNDRRELTLDAFIRRMTAADLDSEARPAVTHAEASPLWANAILAPTGTPARRR
jgi:hypothetical protein